MDVLHLSLSFVILIDSCTGSPVHALMSSIQAMLGLPRLRAPGIVPCTVCREEIRVPPKNKCTFRVPNSRLRNILSTADN